MDKGLEKNITIADVAEALGVSKTTVSRAISGKGRIGRETRERVLAYIEEHDYKPNVIAKGLAQSKTYNICVVNNTYEPQKTVVYRGDGSSFSLEMEANEIKWYNI